MTKPEPPREWEIQARAVGGADSDEELSQASLLHTPTPEPRPCAVCGYSKNENDAHVGISHLPFSKAHTFTPRDAPRPGETDVIDWSRVQKAGTPETPDTENRINNSYAEKRIETPSALECICTESILRPDSPWCPVHDGPRPGKTPSALSAASEVSINEASRIIKKIEASEGMPAKLILLRIFGERYAADLRSKLSTAERERDELKELNQILAQNAADASNESGKFALRVAAAEAELAQLRIERDIWARTALRTGGEPKEGQ